jgi:Adenylate and Guanylate cyclase catalytic domain
MNSWIDCTAIETARIEGRACRAAQLEDVSLTAARVERRLAAIMATDIVGYSRLIHADEAATLTAIRALRAEVVDPVSPSIRAGSPNSWATEPWWHCLRVGVNLGDVVVEGDDIFGDGVKVAARLEQLAPPGEVLISGTAYDQMRGKLNLPLDNMGEQRVKNIPDPVRTYSVRMDGAPRAWKLRLRRLRRRVPIAVAAAAISVARGGDGTSRTRASRCVLAVRPAIRFSFEHCAEAPAMTVRGQVTGIIIDYAPGQIAPRLLGQYSRLLDARRSRLNTEWPTKSPTGFTAIG